MTSARRQDTFRLESYNVVRRHMRPGDTIAFCGKGVTSNAVRFLTRDSLCHWSPVSHLGVVTHVYEGSASEQCKRVLVTESTSLNGKTGVFTRYMSDVLAQYNGRIWWLPLDAVLSESLDLDAAEAYLTRMRNAKYDYWQCVRAGFRARFGFNMTPVNESSKRVFCSEHVAWYHLAANRGAFRALIGNASTVTPLDYCRLPIYNNFYRQLKGRIRPIAGFNVGVV